MLETDTITGDAKDEPGLSGNEEDRRYLDMTTQDARDGYRQAAGFFLDTVSWVRPEQWDQPGLGQWSIRGLVGHTARSFLTLETCLGQPAAVADLSSPAEYFVVARATIGDPELVAQRGRETAASLGAEPVPAIRDIANRVLDALVADPAEVVTTPVGGMHLGDYLATRTFELVVHTLDVAVALGIAVQPPDEAAAVCLRTAADLALRTGRAGDVLLALTGRRPLPSAFSVL